MFYIANCPNNFYIKKKYKFFQIMNIRTIILCIIALSFNSLFSQPPDISYTRDWGTYFGEASMGASAVSIEETTVDNSGNIWIVGQISEFSAGVYFDNLVTPNAHQTIYGGGDEDGFIVKFSSDGELLYASYFGGEGIDIIRSVDTKNGKLVIAGETTSQTNIATSGAFQEELLINTNPNGQDVMQGSFIAQFDDNGHLDWATYFQGDQITDLLQVRKGYSNDLFVWGGTKSSDMATPGAFRETIPPPIPHGTGFQIPTYPVLARFSDTGGLLWATYYGPDITETNGYQINYLGGLAVDFLNNVYVSGMSNDNEGYFGTSGTHQTEVAGDRDVFIGRFNDNGNRVWGTYFGGPSTEALTKIDVPRGDYLYISGITSSQTGITTPGAYQYNYSGTNNSPFLTKLDLNGQQIWGTYFGSGISSHVSLAEDSQGNVYIYSATNSTTGIATEGSFQEINAGGYDTFLTKFNSTGDEVLWSSYYGSVAQELTGWNTLLNINGTNEIYITGLTSGISENLSSQNAFQDEGSNFIAKFVYCPEVLSPVAVSPQAYEPGATLEDLEVEFFEWTGSNLIITWYADEEGTVELPLNAELVDGETYYVSQQIQGCDESELTPVTVIETTMGIDTPIQYQIVLYPNPNKGTFYIDGIKEKTRIQVFDLQGRQLKEAITSEPVYEVDLGDSTASGLYLVKVEAQGGRIQQFKVLID